jgi:cell filamentation protein
VNDLHTLHRTFLGGIYPWAGIVRSVNISKGGFTFATSYALPQALKDFEKRILTRVAFPKNIVRRAVTPASAAS